MSDFGDLDKRIGEKLAARREQAYQHYNHQAERWHEWQNIPVFFQFAGHDQMTLPIDRADEAKVAAWFEEKIMCFLDA